MWELGIKNLENKNWEAIVGPDINDPPANEYRIVQTANGLSLVMCSSLPYSGWLAKHVEPLLLPLKHIFFDYSMLIDECTLKCAQVAETDTKITDSEGYTYDLSAQWNIANDWMFQVDNENWTWVDTGVRILGPDVYVSDSYSIEYELDYSNKRSRIPAFYYEDQKYETNADWISAKKVGWAFDEIVTQLQQCNNSESGGYTLLFSSIGYRLLSE